MDTNQDSVNTPLRLAVDLDGVIHDPTNIEPGYKLGKPIPGAMVALWQLHNEGAIIVIHSIWADTQKKREAISAWCRFFKIPYDFITNEKPDADVYLDNKAIRFHNWDQAMNDIKKYT